MNPEQQIYVAGHRGVVGAAILRALAARGAENLVLRSHDEVNLTAPSEVDELFRSTRPEIVIIAAAVVGGIAANIREPVRFLVDNLEIQNNLLLACRRYNVAKTIFLGSSCIYPRAARQPMHESAFMTGPLEPTNESYAVAKIAGIRLAQALRTEDNLDVILPMPCNVYGPGDHFEFERSHVMSALVRRFCEAHDTESPSVTIWGTGAARREFIHVDDLADACLFLLDEYSSPEIINVGTGVDYSIRELADLIATEVGYRGSIEWDTTKPDGMPQKLLDVSRLHSMGWTHRVDIEQGVKSVIADFRARQATFTESVHS